MKVCRKKILKKHRDNMKKHAVVDEKGFMLLPPILKKKINI
jgi:hypothetical protein